jgi:hypothetical protein
MKNTSFSSVWPAFPFTLCRLAVFLLLSSFSSSPFTSTFSLGVGILGVHAAAYDLLPGDPAFIYDQGWHVPPEWNTTGNADAANGFNLTNITRIGTINSGFHLTFQGISLFYHLIFVTFSLGSTPFVCHPFRHYLGSDSALEIH